MAGSASPSATPLRSRSAACAATTSPRSQRLPRTTAPSLDSSGRLQPTPPPDRADPENRDAPCMLASSPASILNHKSRRRGIPRRFSLRETCSSTGLSDLALVPVQLQQQVTRCVAYRLPLG